MNDGRVCRVCLAPESSDSEFDSIFAGDSKIALRIFLISGVQIIENQENGDPLICAICIKELHCADLFRVKCLEAERIFRLKRKNGNPTDYVLGSLETNEDVLALQIKEENETVDNSDEQKSTKQLTAGQFSFITISESSQNRKANVETFSRKSLMRRHFQKIHNESQQTNHGKQVNLKRNENAECQICNRIFRRNGTLKLHLQKVHSKKSSFACDLCGDQFLLKMSLLKHLRTDHERFKLIKFKRNENAQCPICNRSFSRRDTMKNHVTKIHNKKLELTCDLCGDLFTLKVSLQKHIKEDHLKIRRNRRVEVICSVCGKILTTLSGLQQHMRRHEEISEAKSYQCSHCFKKFKTSVALKGHEVRAHEKRYERKCPLCPSTFSGLSNFNLHYKRIHLNQRDFKCLECDKDFVTKTLLKIHQTVHTGEKKHECIYCQMRFRLYESKKKHEKRCLRKMTAAGLLE